MFIKFCFVILVEFSDRETNVYNLPYQHETGIRMSVSDCLQKMEVKTMGKSVWWKGNGRC